jgi:hypothetical protein
MRFLRLVVLVAVLAACRGSGAAPPSTTSPSTTTSSPALADTSSTSSTTTTSSTLPATSTTRRPATTTSTVPLLTNLAALAQAEAYDPSGKARRVWLAGEASGLLIDLAEDSVGRIDGLPFAEAGAGVVAEDGSIVVTGDGKLWRRTPTGEWQDLAQPGTLVGYTPGAHEYPHLHLYVAEGGTLHNVELRFESPDRVFTKWSVPVPGARRVSVSAGAHLVLVEQGRQEDGPSYMLLGEGSGAAQQEASFPRPDDALVWGAEFLDGRRLSYFACERETYSDCRGSPGFVVDLDSGQTIPLEQHFPAFSREWADPLQPPVLALRYQSRVLLTSHHLFLVDLAGGDRTLLLRAESR